MDQRAITMNGAVQIIPSSCFPRLYHSIKEENVFVMLVEHETSSHLSWWPQTVRRGYEDVKPRHLAHRWISRQCCRASSQASFPTHWPDLSRWLWCWRKTETWQKHEKWAWRDTCVFFTFKVLNGGKRRSVVADGRVDVRALYGVLCAGGLYTEQSKGSLFQQSVNSSSRWIQQGFVCATKRVACVG